MQFLRHGHGEYIGRVMSPARVDIARLESKEYQEWTPYQCTSSEDRSQGAEEGQSEVTQRARAGVIVRFASP